MTPVLDIDIGGILTKRVNNIIERHPFDAFHREVSAPVHVLRDVINRHDRRMREPRLHSRFTQKALLDIVNVGIRTN